MNIYVGNLPYSTSPEQLRAMFEAYGTVESSFVVTDKFTGRSRGFGFVEMRNEEEARAATDAMNGMQLNGRALVVNEARPREERPRRDMRSRDNSGYRSTGFRQREHQNERF
ncbi:MAG: RNA-binding protein [Bacteroidota bacterium]|nr:RNA-binding protein [Candidatus Kapabacteria bacterium]MDW8220359.1 RNA-binding protein [Bacteroidota bacterium]